VPKQQPAPPAAAKRGIKADAKMERALRTWKRLYLASRKATQDVDLARSLVKGLFDKLGVDYVVSSLGTIALRAAGASTITDWEGLARKLLPHELIEQHLPNFTTSRTTGAVLAAPNGWSAEAGC
jgi:hypothetical protein